MQDHVVVGDMNLHHPLWGGAHVEADREADELIDIVDEHDLVMLTKQGLVTWNTNKH